MECISNASSIFPNEYLYVYIISEFQSKPQIMVAGENDAIVLSLNTKSILFRVIVWSVEILCYGNKEKANRLSNIFLQKWSYWHFRFSFKKQLPKLCSFFYFLPSFHTKKFQIFLTCLSDILLLIKWLCKNVHFLFPQNIL